MPKARTKSPRHENSTELRVPLSCRSLAIIMHRKDRCGDGLLFPAKTRYRKNRAVEEKTIQTAVYSCHRYSQTRQDAG